MLNSITITGFIGRHERLECGDLNKGFNVFVGQNGTGKTIFLNLLCHHLQGVCDFDLEPLIDSYRTKGLFQTVTTDGDPAIPCLLLSGDWIRHARHRRTPTGNLLTDKIKENLNALMQTTDRLSVFKILGNFFEAHSIYVLFGGDKVSDGATVWDLAQLSSGEQTIMYIITSAYLMKCRYGDFLLLADTIEQSLHIDWCKKLPDTLITLCAQIIMVTHNPAMVMGKDEYCRLWDDCLS